jgi:hypothetical protein
MGEQINVTVLHWQASYQLLQTVVPVTLVNHTTAIATKAWMTECLQLLASLVNKTAAIAGKQVNQTAATAGKAKFCS